ncbi:MAG TPA: hypothetical protein PKD90_14430 [Phnomibacter sp.]|nr:hypothetical protein [Phnomibacter sp.]
MKKLLFTALTLLVINSIISAQKPGVEIRAGVGLISAPAIGTVLSSSIIGGLAGYTKSEIKGAPALGGSFLLQPSKSWSFGADVVYEKLDVTYKANNRPNVTYSDRFLTIMPRADFKYLNKDNIQLYGSLAAGLSLLKSSGNNSAATGTTFAYQFSPIGLRVGKNFGFFTELGFGFRGLVMAGLSARL